MKIKKFNDLTEKISPGATLSSMTKFITTHIEKCSSPILYQICCEIADELGISYDDIEPKTRKSTPIDIAGYH